MAISQRRIDPDPVALALQILGAIGSVTAIADLSYRFAKNWARLQPSALRRIVAALDSAERAAIELGAKVDTLVAFVRSAETEQLGELLHPRPHIGFGATILRFSKAELREWQRLQNDVGTYSKQLQHAILQVLTAFATEAQVMPRERGDEAHALLETLNAPLRSLANENDLIAWLISVRQACEGALTLVRGLRSQNRG